MKIWRFELKRRENTVWDYVVPLSLVGLAIISSLDKVSSLSIDIYFIILFLFLVTIYSSRSTRILIWVFSLFSLFTIVIFFLATREFWETSHFIYNFFDALFEFFFLILYLSLGFSIGNFSMYLIYGNNVKEKITRKPSAILTAIAFASYGFYIDLLWFFTSFFPYPVEKPFFLEELGIWKSFFAPEPFGFWGFFITYPLLLFLIGFAVGKYRHWRAKK